MRSRIMGQLAFKRLALFGGAYICVLYTSNFVFGTLSLIHMCFRHWLAFATGCFVYQNYALCISALGTSLLLNGLLCLEVRVYV